MFNKEKKIDTLKTYKDPMGGLSGRDLALGTWWVRNKEMIRRISVGLFIAVDVVLVSMGLYGWLKYVLFDYTQDRQALVDQTTMFQNYAVLQAHYKAQDLSFASPQVFRSGDGLYDFVIDGTNPNERWIATVTYEFTYAGGSTHKQTMTLMPGTRQPLVLFGVSESSRPSSVTFVPVNVSWKRIDPHAVFDITDYLEKRNQFVTSDLLYTPAGDVSLGGDQVAFSITNNSVFSYWAPQFFVELRDGSSRQGIVPITLDQFSAGSTEPVDLRLFGEDTYVTDVVLYPLVNFFDENEFMK